MSLLLRDEHRIVLGHDQVMLAVARRELTRRGMKRHVLAEQVLPNNAAGGEMSASEMPWHGSLNALKSILPGLAPRNSHATVTLSNHFVRYALIPWSEALSNDREEMAFARHLFREMFGSDADSWELRINHNKAGMAQLACAVDTRLLDELRGLFGRARIRLNSIQPHLMAAYNSCSSLLHGRSAWLALPEPGNLCLALLRDGQWCWVRVIRTGAGWRDELPLLLEREEFLANADATINEVFLWFPDQRDDVLPESGRWQFRYLPPPHLSGPVAGQGKQFETQING